MRCEGKRGVSEANLKKAIEMSADEYAKMGNLAKVGLNEYARPLDEYAQEYLNPSNGMSQ